MQVGLRYRTVVDTTPEPPQPHIMNVYSNCQPSPLLESRALDGALSRLILCTIVVISCLPELLLFIVNAYTSQFL